MKTNKNHNQIIKAKTTYWQMAKAMWQKLKLRDSGLIPLCFVYTVFATLYPLLGVFLPRMLIVQIEQARSLVWTGGQMTSTQTKIFINIGLILLIYFIAAAILGGLSTYISNLSYARLSYLRLDFISDCNHKVMTMDYYHYEDADFMDHAIRAMHATQSNNNGVEKVYRQVFMLPAKLIAAAALLVFLGLLDLRLIILPLLSLIAIYYALNRTDAFIFKQRQEISHATRRLYNYSEITNDFTYGKDIRLFNLKTMIIDAFNKMIGDRIRQLKLSSGKRFRYNLFPLFFQIASTIVTLSFLVSKALAGQLAIATFAFYLSSYVSLNLIFEEIATALNDISNEGRYVKEMLDFINADLNQQSGFEQVKISDQIKIEFKDVSFHYPNSDQLVLENLNLTLHNREKLALVGINGAGKSTLVKLMTGLHHPTSGSVLINGQDTKNLDPKSLFKLFGVVFQEEKPIAVTVAEQVAGSITEIEPNRVEQVLARAGLLSKIEIEPNGIETNLLKVLDKDGLMLSGGETQKLMIARALYKDPQVMILDEPTSALDALAETEVYQDFSRALKNKTGLFISHRLASTSFCDRIVLLSGGSISEVGTHQELMQAQGEYYEMFVTQGKYYQEEEK